MTYFPPLDDSAVHFHHLNEKSCPQETWPTEKPILTVFMVINILPPLCEKLYLIMKG